MTTGLRGIHPLAKLPLENKTVFLRVDFNVPLDEKGQILDDTRIQQSLPTIKYIMKKGRRVILASHLGHPLPNEMGKIVDADRQRFSLESCGLRLAELLQCDVHMPEDCIGKGAKKAILDLRAGQLCLLENLRFHAEEKANRGSFARALASFAEVYVNDAFGTLHRTHASVCALPKLFRDRGCGFLVEKEILALERLKSIPPRPYVAILGGAKIADKLGVLYALLDKVDSLIIGGAMANTLLAAQGYSLQASLVETDKLALARSILKKAEKQQIAIHLPLDVITATSTHATEVETVPIQNIPPYRMALDIGSETRKHYAKVIEHAKTIFWNGPMGLFEKPIFAAGTLALANKIATLDASIFIGGGDTVAAIQQGGPLTFQGNCHLSTGGGAALELIEGKELPGLEALRS
ncbi:phosphoglycerate kinase [Pajaroellobacter abortibovis]|uniref:Phosphoglycerate kinase n=2 Tax=Pajaroellobacter abortibovis TaxID=1882918 RepID=A0A1L6MVH4_9BACT|nr:phosphoglycerate kinase [Pajaroellobacter abortibovis]